ncbi:MAG: hypothetical protein M4579_003923 [Chaenotheca gracillima]|nr:MAG: hypothetical protein M4579_003923 [Chaenotheca gracillima]
MFSSALKSFSSNITSNYTISTTPSSLSGPWKIYEAKKKSTGKVVSVFSFERKSLDPNAGLGRSGGPSLRRIHDDVVERLKKEASSLARLRHPSVLELVEPVEDTRSGGIMFATEQVTASLAGLLEEKDSQERASGVGGRSSRYVVEEAEGGRRRREVEIDELEIQKGLLQIGKGLEFLHESAGLVHGNMSPEAIYINAKSDWKISGLAFCSAADDSEKATSVGRMSLSDVLQYDPRLPRTVQMNFDYTSPDFILDNNITTSADMFSLGLVIVALYNSPHTSPLQANSSISAYKRLFSSSSTVPSQSNQYLSSRPLPKDLTSTVLPRLLTRRPAQRVSAREFQQSPYFDNILVSTIRFLDSFPAKTPSEKAQFMRGLPRVLTQFPKSVLEKKVLPALVEEMKDHDLLSLVLQNIFKLIKQMPSGRRAFTDIVTPRLRDIFLKGGASSKTKSAPPERDVGTESGLKIVIDNLDIIIENCSGKDFKDDILPLVRLGLESPTNSLVDVSLQSVKIILPVLDYSTIKNEFFPVVATVFTKTSSLGIKVRGLEAFVALCGGAQEDTNSLGDGLDGAFKEQRASKTSSNSALDKYTMQEKVMPLIKAIKTKEPAVMMATLNVLKRVGEVADSDFVATEVLPLLWSMSLGPLLNLQQFQAFMELIRALSTRVEREHTRKLEELSSSSVGDTRNVQTDDFMNFGSNAGTNGSGPGEGDFESLVFGRHSKPTHAPNSSTTDWGEPSSARPSFGRQQSKPDTPTFSWSTQNQPLQPTIQRNISLSKPNGMGSRSITPDLSSFAALSPTNPSQPPAMSSALQPQNRSQPTTFGSSNHWQTQTGSSTASMNSLNNSMSGLPFGQSFQQSSGFNNPMTPSQPPNPGTGFAQPQASNTFSSFSIAPPPARNTSSQPQITGLQPGAGRQNPATGGSQNQSSSSNRSGLDKFESLL